VKQRKKRKRKRKNKSEILYQKLLVIILIGLFVFCNNFEEFTMIVKINNYFGFYFFLSLTIPMVFPSNSFGC